jgi:hypothetical protein
MGVGKDVVVGTRRERVEISRPAIRTRPISRVDGRGCDVGAPALTGVGIVRVSNADVICRSRPLRNQGKCAAAPSLA